MPEPDSPTRPTLSPGAHFPRKRFAFVLTGHRCPFRSESLIFSALASLVAICEEEGISKNIAHGVIGVRGHEDAPAAFFDRSLVCTTSHDAAPVARSEFDVDANLTKCICKILCG
ncbi:hypothetical protein, partial [Mesorhizobium sp.]|uniref:hypothetical protein n=1 Tax=Mesorhizobium sp. TaxID=1871066 RepID=UPI0025BE9B86